MRVAPRIVLTDEERARLEALAISRNGDARLAQRAHIILLAAQGVQNKTIAQQLGVGRAQVARWRERYAQSRVAGIEHDLPRGAPPIRVDVAKLVTLTTQDSAGSPRAWTTRSLAAELRVSAASVSRHWRATGLAPAPRDGSTLAQAPDFGGRAAHIVALYVSPPEHAVVFALDAPAGPDGTQSGQAHGERASHPATGYRRNLAASFMTAVKVLDGKPGAEGGAGQRQADWLAFLRDVVREAPPGKLLQVVADNHVSHYHSAVQQWLLHHPQLDTHFAPNAAAWQRTVQRVLRDMQAWPPAVRFPAGIPQALAAIEDHLASRQGAPFRWIQASGAGVVPAVPMATGSGPAEITALPVPATDRANAPQMTPQTAPLTGRPPASSRTVQPIASTKLLPPRGTRQLMPREALMARLLEARRQCCVVIQGQAGSGKTSTLMAWRRELIPLGFDVTWLSLSVEDNEPARFFECLLASIAELDPAVVSEAALLVGRERDELSIEHAVITLVHALGKRQRELVLMIDDLHHIVDARIFQALQWLLDYAPPQLHLALSSRSALPLSMECLRLQGGLAEFDMRDLRFTEAESERFLREQLGTIDKRDAAALHALTDGWVAGLQLFAVDLRTRQGGEYPLMQVRDPRAFASYFEREVLVQLAADDLDMLVRVAICHRFCAPLCASLLGQPQALSRIRTSLARFEADNLFIAQIGSHDRETWYRIHPLLRETLLTRLALRSADDQRVLHEVAWRWFDARGQIDDAVYHAVKAGDVGAAAGMVEACAQALLALGELNQLAGLLRRLPLEQVQMRFGLHLVMAHLQMYSRNFDALRQSLAQMEAQRGTLNAHERYKLCLLHAAFALQRDDTDTAAAMLPELWDIPADAEEFTWYSRSNVLSLLFISQGEYDRARRVLEDTGRSGGAPRSILLGRCISAMSLALEGHNKQTGKIAREVLQEAERQGKAYVGLACMAAALLAHTLNELNETEAACQVLEPRIGLLERVSMPDTVLRALVVLSNAHWAAGRREQACACLDRLEAYAVRYSLDRLLADALELRLRRHLQLAEMERANTVLASVESLAVRHAGAGATLAGKVRSAAVRARIEMYLHTHDFSGAVGRIEPLIAEFEQRGQWLGVASLRLQLAMAQQGLGNVRAARDAFLAAMRQGHRLGLVRTLLDVISGAPEAFAELASQGATDPVLAFYIKRLQAAATIVAKRGTRPAGAAVPTESLSEREREILSLLAQAMSNKKIATVLSVSVETVKWHLKNIYAKLGVSGRGGAAARLRDLHACAPAGTLQS